MRLCFWARVSPLPLPTAAPNAAVHAVSIFERELESTASRRGAAEILEESKRRGAVDSLGRARAPRNGVVKPCRVAAGKPRQKNPVQGYP